MSSGPVAAARVWTDASGRYTLEADLVSFDDRTVVLQRSDHELAAVSVESLSVEDREFLKSGAAEESRRNVTEGLQTWTLRDGMEITGRIVDYTKRDLTLQRRRGRIYVNDRVLTNLPEFYQQLIPTIVARMEGLQRADRRALESWLVRQRGQPRTIHVQGVILETENGDEYAVPFALFSDEDLEVLKPGWDDWQTASDDGEHSVLYDHSLILRSLAAARHRDQRVKREIAMLQLSAVRAGLTSLWEVTLYPASGQNRPPQWVVVSGRDSRQAINMALQQHSGYVAGPVRRVAGR
jgi:hypothetical protein